MRSIARRATLIALTLSGCAGGSSVATNDYCQIYEPVRWSTADTRETQRQIARENAKYLCLCLSDCPDAGAGRASDASLDERDGAAGQD